MAGVELPEYLGRMAEVKSNGSAPTTPREP